MVKMTVNC